jgi:hypothetical protein
VLFPVKTWAAQLYLDPATGNFQFGQTFVVDIKVDTQGECINAANVEVDFDPKVLQLVDFGNGNSMISLWTQMPDQAAIGKANVSGQLNFEGGMPGGYCGEIVGSAGESNSLGKLVFMTPGTQVSAQPGPVQTAVAILDSSEIYLHDGLGTKAALTVQGANFSLSNKSVSPRDDWGQALKNDTTPPEQFEIKVNRDPSMFGGKYFIIFNTTDKQTGIDHYEVAETPLNAGQTKDQWTQAVSPYLLKDQKLHSTIKVKAVDQAGNQTIAQFVPGIVAPAIKLQYLIYLFGILAAIALLVLFFVKKIKKKSSKHE